MNGRCHWWVAISLALTVVATAIVLAKAPMIAQRAQQASDPGTTGEALAHLGNMLPHSIGGAVVLGFVLALNVAKPRGLTRYGWRRQAEERAARGPASQEKDGAPGP